MARHFASAHLAEWRLSALADDVDLVISELITNALLHGGAHHTAADPGAAVRLDLEYDGQALVCRIADGSPLPPSPEQPGCTAESGRGLLLVEALCSAWGWRPGAHGKTVWARFDVG
jgi:anti-sigma regulatory factor (Ser/Thr protein kinase)